MIAAGIFLALMAASLLVSGHYQPANALETYKKSLRDKGEKLELNEVLPPPVPAEQNCVEAVQAAFAAFSPGNENIPNAMRMVAPGKAIVGLSQPDVRDPEFTN